MSEECCRQAYGYAGPIGGQVTKQASGMPVRIFAGQLIGKNIDEGPLENIVVQDPNRHAIQADETLIVNDAASGIHHTITIGFTGRATKPYEFVIGYGNGKQASTIMTPEEYEVVLRIVSRME